MLTRRKFIESSAQGAVTLSLAPAAKANDGKYVLSEIPTTLDGDWGAMYKSAVMKVIQRARAACLSGVRQLSDRQPRSLMVERHTSGPPAIWLHSEQADRAWIIVNIGERDWSKLAYQFGHELGHVMANSWMSDDRPTSASTCQWIEEAAAEALSIYGLRQLSASWAKVPPFPGDSAFGASLKSYYENIENQYQKYSEEQGGLRNLRSWFFRNKLKLESEIGLNEAAKAFSTVLLDIYIMDPSRIEALGALNRWPQRAALNVDDYLKNWSRSCRELGANPYLPRTLLSILEA